MFQLKTILAGAALSLVAGAATAAPVAIRDNAHDNGASVFADGLGRNVAIGLEGERSRVRAGVFSLEYESQTQGWTSFLSFSLQLSERLTLPKAYEHVEGRAYAADAADRAALGALINNFLTEDLGLADATSAAALQVIVWEVVEDGSDRFDLRRGDFKVLTRGVRARADTLWGMIADGLADEAYDNTAFNVFSAEGTQDLILETPIPGAISLILSGFAGLSLAARRRKTL